MNKLSRDIDIYTTLLLIDLFCIIVFLILYPNSINMENYIILGILFTILFVTFFTGLVIGLLSSAFSIFIYGSLKLYENIVQGASISVQTYIWIAAIPLSAFIMGRLSSSIQELQRINTKLEREYRELVTIDSDTGLNNLKAFHRSLEKQISYTIRHKDALTLLLFRIHFFDELKAYFGEEKLQDVIINITRCVNSATRTEDERYKLSKDMLAVLMPNTDLKGAEIVRNRIRENVKNLNVRMNEEGKNVSLDFKIGIYQYNENIKNSFEFKELAEKELEYDV